MGFTWLALLLAATPLGPPVVVQPQQVAPPDAARLQAARQVVDSLLPPTTREQMVQSMIVPMLSNMRQGMTSNPQFAKVLDRDPRIRELFDQFLKRQEDRMLVQMRAALPGMSDAMAIAYARRFDLEQLAQIKSFFESPTGKAYKQASITIMSDPDIAAWQRSLMNASMSHLQEDAADFARHVAALQEKQK